jgi:hypothetical protein
MVRLVDASSEAPRRVVLWNIGYNPALRLLESRWTAHFCYADDTLLLIADNDPKNLQAWVKREISAPSDYLGESPGLELAQSKTELFTFLKRGPGPKRLQPLEGEFVKSCAPKYLGVWLDAELN